MRTLVTFAASAMLPPVDGIPGTVDTGLREFVGKMLREAAFMYKLGVVAGSLLFWMTPLITIGMPLPANLLSADALNRHAFAFATSRITVFRQMALLIKMVAGFCWGVDDGIRERHGMAPLPADPGTWRTE